LQFVISRLFQSIIVMIGVALVSFAVFNFAGDPVTNLVGMQSTDEKREEVRESLGLNDSVPEQFFNFVSRSVNLEFGISFQHRRLVTDVIAERLPATLELSIVAALLALLIGVPLGVYTALRRDSVVSQFVMSLSLIGVSLPTFLIGILLIYIFAVTFRILPSFGRGEVVDIGFWSTGLLTISGLKSLILPSITLAMFQMTLIMRLVRSEMLEVLRTDFIQFARARGLTNKVVNFTYALMNTLVPVLTVVGLQLGSIIAFSLITETVFQWPGLGLMFISAVFEVDVPIISTYLLLVALFFVSINLAVDLLYYIVDPRLRVAQSQ